MIEHYLDIPHHEQNLRIATASRQKTSDHLIMFVHGLGCNKESFAGAFSSPYLEGYSIAALDLPGHGESEHANTFPYELRDHASVVLGALAHFDYKRLTLVGHSMGGAISTFVVKQVTEPTAFVNVEGNLVAEDAGIVSRQTTKQSEEAFRTHGYQAFLGGLRTSDRTDLATWATWLQQADSTAVHRSAHSLVEWSDSGALLGTYNSLPDTTYIHGDEDAKEYVTGSFTQSRVVSIPGSGHFPMLTNPDAFYHSIATASAQLGS